MKLFMLLLGCRPKGRHTEQHDIFFGIGSSLKDLIPDIKKYWPEAKGIIHIDAWREVNCVDGYSIEVSDSKSSLRTAPNIKADLFFINLGGYKENEFDEFHYKMIVVAESLDMAKNKAKKTAFFKHTSLPVTPNHRNATAHIDDKYGIDIDDIYQVADILPVHLKEKYTLVLEPDSAGKEDEYHLGYFRLVDL